MISLQQLNPHNYPTTPEIDSNLLALHKRINIIRLAWGNPMTVTSGLRSEADQMRINPKAPKSNHLIGAACDIADTQGDLKDWVLTNVSLLEATQLWCESFDSTPTWVHFQIFSPVSGKRFFIP